MKKKKECIISFLLAVLCLLSACGSAASGKNEPGQGESVQEMDQPENVEESDIFAGTLRITEIMAKNGAVLQCADGSFCDWVEIENISSSQVPLEGWSLVKNEKEYAILNGSVLQPGELTVVFASGAAALNEMHAECKIAPGDLVSLSSPGGTRTPAVECFEDAENVSVALNTDGVFSSCIYPTPGAANTHEEYDRLSSEQIAEGPLVINEVMGKNARTVKCGSGYEDWIELKNVSSSYLNLSDYYLSDKASDPFMFRLPERNLAPGEIVLVWCSGEYDFDEYTRDIHSNFKISGSGESIYLSNSSGYVDYLAFPNLPTDWSFGREERQNGWFIFPEPTPGNNNSGGFRRMTEEPDVLTQPGCYDGVNSVSVELSGKGTIRYTTDGSVPNDSSQVYSDPITVTKTTIIRCFMQEEGLAPGNERILTYFINEGHSLPVLSLVADDFSRFKGLYYKASLENKNSAEIPGSLSLYENGEIFSQKCSISMKGWTSLDLPKKSMGVKFKGAYGGGAVKCDLFGDMADYSALSIRAGQDYTSAVIRNELVQELCMDAGNNVPTQHGKYCALYINGNYWGTYCLKEDVSKDFYAAWAGVDSSEVMVNKSPASEKTPVSEIIRFCIYNDMAEKDNYDYFCSVFDIDNLIDWTIMEGFSSNTDINGNMRYFKTENGKWQIVLYDIDWALLSWGNARTPFSNILKEDRVQIGRDILGNLMKNEEFRRSFYERAEEMFGTALSNEHVLEKIEELANIVEPEISRDRERWSMYDSAWYGKIDYLKSYITDNNWDEKCLSALRTILKIESPEIDADGGEMISGAADS